MGRRNRLLVGACLVVGCGTILRASGASALTATDGPAAHHQTGNLQKGCCANDLNPRAFSPKVRGYRPVQSWMQDFTQVSID